MFSLSAIIFPLFNGFARFLSGTSIIRVYQYSSNPATTNYLTPLTSTLLSANRIKPNEIYQY